MWQSSKAYPLAYCPPGRWLARSYIRGRCPRLLKVVPSRHQSACGSYFYHGFNGFNGLDGFTVRGDCALMRPIGLT